MMEKKYEFNQLYVSLPEDGLNHVEKLNAFGKEGWQLVQCLQMDNRNYTYIFQRELQNLLTEGERAWQK